MKQDETLNVELNAVLDAELNAVLNAELGECGALMWNRMAFNPKF